MDLKTKIEQFVPQTKEEKGIRDKILCCLSDPKTAEEAGQNCIVFLPVLNPCMKRLRAFVCRPAAPLRMQEEPFLYLAGQAAEDMRAKEVYPVSGGVLSLHEEDREGTAQYIITAGLLMELKRSEETPTGRADADVRPADWPQAIPRCVYETALARMRALHREKQAVYVALPTLLPAWYGKNARDLPWRRDTDPYHVWVSEIMLQQTRVGAVQDYYTRFLQVLPTIEALAQADAQGLHKLWEGLGYYARVRNLHKAAQKIMREYNGRFPIAYKDVLSLPGIGEYTAGAICSICFGQPTPAVDGNVLRVIARLTENFARADSPVFKRMVRQTLAGVYPNGKCGEFTQSLMELGATVCLPGTPRCPLCPAADLCMARKQGTQAFLPVRQEKKRRRIEQRTVFVLLAQDRVALRKRPDSGLLAGLWELPNLPGKLTAKQALETAAGWGVENDSAFYVTERKHIFTHVEWCMTCYYLRCKQQVSAFTWADQAAIQRVFALPTAFRLFLEKVPWVWET